SACGGGGAAAMPPEGPPPPTSKPAPDAERSDLPREAPRFAWPVSRAVPVSEHVEKNGADANLRYLVSICPMDGGRVRIAHTDLPFETLNGIPADDPKVKGVVDRLAPVMAAIPTFVVEPSGEAVDVEGMDEMALSLGKLMTPENLARMKQLLASEQAREI